MPRNKSFSNHDRHDLRTHSVDIPEAAKNPSVIKRYLSYQIPGLIILSILILVYVLVLHMPSWGLWVLIAAWFLKEAVTLPFTWKLYRRARPSAADLMIGQVAEAAEPLNPRGYVNVLGELWMAELADKKKSVKKGERVRTIRIEGMTLIVEPLIK
jgi:membrane protein implicated in regulation of membrane protease activity